MQPTNETDSTFPPLTEGEVVERISKEDLVPINDTNHTHLFEKDPDDETDGYYAEMCVVQNCGLGRLVAK